MSAYPGSPQILQGAFIRYDAMGQPPKILVFPYNPETLTRTILPAAPGSAANQGGAAGSPQETIQFTLPLDATDALERGDSQAARTGVYPLLAALELLMYPTPTGGTPLTLFVWGQFRILPVRVVGLQILESLFEPNLSPIRASVQVTLQVESTAGAKGFLSLPPSVATLGALAAAAYASSPAATGVTLPPAHP